MTETPDAFADRIAARFDIPAELEPPSRELQDLLTARHAALGEPLDPAEVERISSGLGLVTLVERIYAELLGYCPPALQQFCRDHVRVGNTRKALIRDALVSLIDQIDADLRELRALAGADPKPGAQLHADQWAPVREHMKQVEVLLGSSVTKPVRWSDMMRHIKFGYVGDLDDIERVDWPNVKSTLRKGLYGVNEPVPVRTDDLAALVAARPKGPISTALDWSSLNDEGFERLVFTLISDTPGYENPEWLMQTRAPDRGRDLSVIRVSQDELSGILRLRVIIQCKHWLSRSVNVAEVATAKEQMALWPAPRVDVLVFATSGRFTADAVAAIEAHNAAGSLPRIEMWAESHLERLLAARPAVIAEFGLRGH